MATRKEIAQNQKILYDDAVANNMFQAAVPTFEEFQKRLEGQGYQKMVYDNYRKHNVRGKGFNNLNEFRGAFGGSFYADENKIGVSAGVQAISASANNSVRQAKRNIQTKLGQAKKFNGGRVTPRLKNPLQNQNVQKNEFNYNSTTGKTGTYTTTDGVEFDNEYDATQYQNKLDKYGEEWSKAVGMGIVPSELDKADPDLSDTDVAKRQMERRQEWLNENQNRRSKELNESMHLQGSPFVASGGAVAPSSFNTAISNEANRLSDVEYGAYNTAKAYNQMLRTTLLQELKEQKQRNENAGWWKDKWNDVSNYFGAMFDTLLDPKLYSQGIMDAAISNNLLQVKKGMEDGTIKKGSNAGNAAQAMLGAIQQQQSEAARQQQYGTKAYQYGDMSGRSFKFMGDFALSGWRNVMTTGFTKAGEKVGEKMALGALGKWFTKNTGRVLGDIAGSAALASTNQLGSTYNNVIERYVGMNNENGGVTQDKNGDLKFNEGVSLGKAIKDGFGSATIENFSEMFGEYLPGAPKLLSKLGLSKVSAFFEKIGDNAYYKWLSNATNKSGIQGVMAEISEEEFGTALHAAWGDGDGSWSDFNVFTNPDAREKQIDTCLGMFYSVGFMQAPRTAVGAINAVQYFNIKHQVAKADKFGQVMFNDKWEEIKSKIDVTTNADLTKTVLDATRSDSMTAKQKGAVINYAMFLSKLRGFNQAADAKTKDKVEEGDTAPTLSNDLDDAYTEGHNADDADKHNIQLEQNDKANELAAMLHITPEQLHDMADEDLEAMTGQDDKLDQAIYDYQVSTAKYQGVMDGTQDEVDMAAQQAAMETDNMTDLSRGTVRKATIKATGGLEDYEVYIISGNIATHDDGSIDVGNSDDMIIYYDPTTGRKEHADAMMFADLIEELPAADVKAQAIIDAKENVIKKIAGIIDGTVEVGSQFSVTDADGTEHTYEVLADNGDGTAMITIDGNVPTELVKGENVQIPYSFADLQQMKDAEDLKRLEAAKAEREQMEKERAEQQTLETQKTQQTEETQPSFDFTQILNDNGNVVLADVLGKDGNTKYPNSQLFLIRDAGAKAKVVELKSDGTIVPHAVNKEDVATISSMSLDEYKQAMPETSMIEDNTGAIEADRGGIEVDDNTQPLSEADADNVIAQMESRAEVAPELELTPDNWAAEFGEDGIVSTPIGDVKMGENQVAKLFEKGRSKEFGMIKPTLTNPDVIIEVPSHSADGNEERSSSYLFIKTFLGKNGKKVYYFKSVTIKKDGLEISISSHYDRAKRVKEALMKGKLLYRKNDGAQTEQNQPSTSVTTSQEDAAGSSESKDTNISANGNENNESLTFEDGTPIPVDENGETDLSQTDAAHAAEWYDTNLGEDADDWLDGEIKKAKKVLEQAHNKKVTGTKPSELVASKKEKEAAIADAQAHYDSAISIRDALKERQLVKVEDTAEGRKELIDKARRKFARLKSAVKDDAEAVAQIYKETVGSLLHRLYDGTGIDVTDTIPLTAEEYVASNLGAHTLNYEGTETSKGVKQETGLSREDFAKTQLLAADGKGTTIDNLVHSLWENRPSNLESLDTQDIRNALIGVLTSGFMASESRNYIENLRIAQAESALEEQKKAADNAAFAEEKKAKQEEEKKADEEDEETSPLEGRITETDEESEVDGEYGITYNKVYLIDGDKRVTKVDEPDEKGDYTGSYYMYDGKRFGDLFEVADYIDGNNSDNINEKTKFPDKLKEGSKTIEVPEDATDENPLGAQLDQTDLPFSARDNGTQQTTSERAADVEKNKVDDVKVVDNIVGKKTRKAFERLAKMMSADIQWQYSDKLGNGWIQETKDVDGNVHRTIFITLDSSITEGAQFIFGHEMTHQIKNLNPAAYNELTQLVLDTYGADAFDKAVDKTMQRYSDAGFSGRARDYYAEEVVADAVGEMIRDLNLAHTLAMKMSHPLLAAIHEILQKIKMAFFGTEYSDVTKNIIRSIEQAYVKTAKGEVSNSETGEDVSFSLRQKPEPKKKGIGYKVFVLKDGKLYPPMVANPNGAETPVGVWLDADAAPIAGESKTGRPQVKQGGKGTQGGSGKLAYRPGWHLGVVPYAIQFNRKDADGNKTLFPKNFVFAEVEYAADVDYQEEARQEGINPSGKYQHSLAGLKHLPTDGYYMYRTNPNPETDPWVITGAMKVNRILTRAEQAELVKKAGREPQQIQEGDIVTDDVVNSINQEIAAAPKFSLKVYHGSGADFTEFDFDHMGEGEGTQAFGWGGYVTSSKKIGKSYADMGFNNASARRFAFKEANIIDERIKGESLFKNIGADERKRLITEAEQYLREGFDDYRGATPKEIISFVVDDAETAGASKEIVDILKSINVEDLYLGDRNLYEVDIPDDNGSNYLDWDKPLSKKQQDAIREGLVRLGVDMKKLEGKGQSLEKTGENVYNSTLYIGLSGTEYDLPERTEGISKFLSSIGFTGIKYKAGRNFGGAKKGDTNYVIFKPEDMRITEHTKFSLRLKSAIEETETNPSDAQKESGNYKKGHIKFGGYDYTIENPKGSTRSGKDADGKEWKVTMHDTYGYIRGKFGKDGDNLDMFINDKADLDNWNGDVFVVDQVNPDGSFDEHKVMYGYDSMDDAKKAYLSNYSKGWQGLGNITGVSKDEFDKWLDTSKRKLKPFKDYAKVKFSLKNDGLTPEIANTPVNIVDADEEHGFKNYAEAREWAKKNIVRTYNDEETGGKGEINISNTAVGKYLSEKAIDKSISKDVHMSVLKVLPSVLRESVDAYQHGDRKKVNNVRSEKFGINPDVMIHRCFGAVNIGGRVYGVKITLKENVKTRENKKLYSYEATKIELLDGKNEGVTMTPSLNSNNSITVAKIAKVFETTKENGEKFSLKDEKTLAGVHNITEEKLRKALKLGGFANPSLAVIDTNKTGHDNFGEISFIAPSALLDKRTGKTAGTWITDAYTQRYPSVEREMSEKGYRKFEDWVDSLDYPSGAKAEIERQAKDALSDNNSPAWELMYLKEKGIDIKEYDSRIDYRWKEIISDHPTAEDILNSMKTDPELNEKVTSLAKHAIIHPTWEKVSLEVRRKMYKETGVKASPINPQVRKQTKEIFERDYAPSLLNKNGTPKKSDVKKVVEQMVKEHNDTKKYDFYLSKVKASNYVNKNGLYDDYIRWQENKLDEFGTKNRIFRGYTRDGSRKYVPETLENVSKVMREEADGQTNGSEYTSFGSFIAKLASRVDSTDEMRANKDKLSSNKDKEEFYEKWNEVYYELAKFLYNDVFYGEQRLHDIVLQSDPKKYAKKEYDITLTPTFMKKLDALKNAVQTELKSAYFETKYNRPLRLNEFAAAVVPDNLGEDVRKGIEDAGLPMYDYDPNKEGDRSRAFNDAINSSDNIRFSLKAEKEKIVADAKANGTYMTAPNGEKTKLDAEQWATVRTTNFKNWFGDWENDPENASKVVDENGEPMVVWHGRSAEFNTFEKKEGVRFIMGLEDKVKAEGFFFSPDKGLAEEFASNSSRHRGGKANVVPCFLNIRKPMDLTGEDYDRIYEDVTGWEYMVGMDTQDNLWGIMDEEGMADKIKEKGYDGAIFVEEVDDSYEPTKISYCALDANQIKSAENNNGDFSADNNDIRYSIRTYHGTGASFDKFDLSHALEGEGSETFGHGVYVTNSSKIGREYAQRAKQRKMADLYKNMRYPDGVKGDIFKRRLFGEMVNDVATGGSVASAKEYAKKRVGADANDIQRTLENLKDREKGTEYEQNLKDRLAEYKEGLKWIDSLDEDYLTQGNANRYDVDIPDDNGSNYLDWEKTLNEEQINAIREALVKKGVDVSSLEKRGFKLDLPFKDVYAAVLPMMMRCKPEDVSKFLSSLGFTGIKYPAGMIYGGAEEGDYNYVIFDENNANIVGNTRFSLRYDQFEHDLNQWKKDNNLPKDAQRPTIPQRNAGESAVDFLKRVDEYRKQMALWKTAPTYEQHLLSDDTALGEFNRELQRGSVLKRIAFQDSMLAIRKAQEAIMKEVGVDRLNMAEDAYTAENRSHGKGKNEFEEYNNQFLQPLRKAYHQMKKILGDSYDNVRIYMMAKHGLERDAQMAFKKSLEADYEDVAQRSAAYRAYKGDMNRIINDSDLEFGRVDFTTWRQRDNALREKYSPSYMDYRYDKNGIAYDYSGLSALFEGSDFEEAAHKLVSDIESNHVAEVQDLWNATNAATKKILRDGYKAGMMSKDAYQYVRDMYSHYIPLRGWDGTTSDQVWDYIGGGKGAFNQTLKTAHGRTSIADDPIAYIENMAESGILLNNKNWVKQHLMLLAQNHPTSLLTLSKAWYVKSTDVNGNEEWIPATPQITSQMNSNQVKAAIDAFEKKMEKMAQTGDATQKRDGLNIAYPQTHSEEREHEVRVMKDGEEYVIYVNGDPQLAQAMNNTRAHRVREIQSGKLDRAAAWLGRKMAAAYTSLSPLFIPSNYFRDLTMTLASTAIREDAKYNYLLRKNLATSWNLGFMLRDYQNGKLREKVSNGNATPKEQMFYDFMMNGGETGFVSSLDVEDLKKKFKNDLKDLDRWKANPVKVGHTIMDGIEFLNRMIEDSNRFAIYMTSIQYGRSIDEAVNDAKDVTLNFNRKGTGEYGWQMVRNLYLFINPAVQSLQTLGALVKHHPFKFTAVTASWLASGVLVPIVNAALMSLLGGDDDKDKYWQFSKWDRRNNLIMWVPFTHEYVKIPLAQEFRAFYGIGDMIASKMMGGELAEESWSQYADDLLGQVVDMLPLDPTGYDGNIAVSLMPNAIRPVFELAFNVDFTGKPLFKDTEYNKYDPNFTKAYVGTPDWLVRASRMVNSIGNDYPDVQQNSIDAFGDPRYNLNNPAVVDHVLSSYLGGAYTMGSQVLGLLTKSLNDPKEIKMADIPLLSKFVSNPDDRPVTKKQGDEFWDMKENHDRAANTLSKLKKQAKVDGDYSLLERFYGSEEYKQYKQDDVKVKKYEEDKKKERAEESGEEYRPHKLNAEDIYKAHATPKDDFEDLKLKQLYTKLNGFKSAYDLLVDTAPSQSEGYYNTNKAAIDAIDEISIDKQEISELKKGFLDDGKDAYNAEDMKQIRELRKKILAVLEKANKVVVANQKAKAEK